MSIKHTISFLLLSLNSNIKNQQTIKCRQIQSIIYPNGLFPSRALVASYGMSMGRFFLFFLSAVSCVILLTSMFIEIDTFETIKNLISFFFYIPIIKSNFVFWFGQQRRAMCVYRQLVIAKLNGKSNLMLVIAHKISPQIYMQILLNAAIVRRTTQERKNGEIKLR